MGLIPNRLSLALLVLTSANLGLSAPQLRLSQTAVGPVSVANGANGPRVAVDAVNVGDGRLNLAVASSVPWIVPTVGALRDCPLRVQGCLPINMELRTGSLPRGIHTGIVTVADPNAVDAPQTVTVTAPQAVTYPSNSTSTLPRTARPQEPTSRPRACSRPLPARPAAASGSPSALKARVASHSVRRSRIGSPPRRSPASPKEVTTARWSPPDPRLRPKTAQFQ